MGSNETLFSLELAVESLRINSSTVVCHLPSVAFRLLDFPTLLLHHVDPEEAQNIKEKIILDSFGDIPCQLQELKDHRGNFCINKCKSSLFKMDPQMLLSYLRNTPLYVMLIDVWPKVPKLVANCTVSLQTTMEEISHDIEQNGSDVPSVHGDRDSYKLYNLMGSEVGWIVVRYRMLSMGASLIPHIPQSEITKRGSETVDLALAVTPRKSKDDGVVRDTKKGNKETDVVLEDLEVQGQPKGISVAVSTIDDRDFIPKPAGSEKKQQATQTIKTTKGSGHRKNVFQRSTQLIRNDDLIVNNTHCPPPLFFNTANEDVPASSDQHRHVESVRRIDQDIQYFLSGRNAEPKTRAESFSEDLSSSSQTQSDDIVHQIETHYKFPSEEQSTASPSWSVRKTHRALRKEKSHAKRMERQPEERKTKSETESAQEAGYQASDICNRCQLKLEPNQRSQLPVLEALLQELSLLHGNSLHNRAATLSRTPAQVHVQHAVAKNQVTIKEPTDEKENVHVNQPKVVHQTKPYRHKHRECAKPPQGVPPTKGWLRQQKPVPKVKRRTKLRFGMTNSQKLRLQKNNPELLREMEIQEARMRAYQEEKEKAIKNHHVTDELDFIDAVNEHDISTEIAHHFEGEDQAVHARHPQKKLPSRADSGKSSASQTKAAQQKRRKEHSDQRNRQIVSPEQPPVAAPRRPKGATYSWADKSSPHSEDGMGTDQEAADDGIGASGTEASDFRFDGSRRDSRGSVVQKDLSSSEKSARSIDVYLPSASVPESDSGSNSDDSTDTDLQFSSASSYVKHPKAIQIPGLPSEQDLPQEAVNQSDDPTDIQYSDDFVGSDNLASTGEQELAPLASNHSDSYHSTHSSVSGTSRSSSVRTTKSQTTQIAGKTPEASGPRPSGKPANPQTRRLSIPKPKLSSISPVPVRKTSKTSTLSINTAVVTPDPPSETKRSQTPPTPKPRPSLLRSASSFSETSLLQSTVPSSEFKTEDSLNPGQWTKQDESSNSYSDDFNNSEPISDHSDTF
ncbi:uncharacterized protein LOC119740874 [Patiria miniata]|uniref:Microtubule-associated protein 10 n=1 Tax=Patiria miniata TaxID=46514 RepID=A0A914B8V1_PATMI|nr:uncharacterized protein LOC119740874 [Patiria miniata]